MSLESAIRHREGIDAVLVLVIWPQRISFPEVLPCVRFSLPLLPLFSYLPVFFQRGVSRHLSKARRFKLVAG